MNDTKKLGIFFVLLIVLFFCSACSVRLANLSVVATQNVNLDKVDLDTLPQVKGIKGKDTVFIFLFIPFGFLNLQDAIDDALRRGDGDLLLDAVIYNRYWWFLIGQSSLEVRGTVVKTRNN